MNTIHKRKAGLLLVGDLVVFIASLWITLFVRYFEIPTEESVLEHLQPFSFLFVVWVLVYFIFGLYEKQGTIFRSELPQLLIRSQLVNIVIAVSFFYFVPWYSISPKTTLFLYLVVSLVLVLLWRMYGYFALVPSSKDRAVIIGSGDEMHELVREIKDRRDYNVELVEVIDLEQNSRISFEQSIKERNVSLVIVDLHNIKVQSVLPHLYNLLFAQVRFVSMEKIYEDVFDRVPLSLVTHSWFLENISTQPKVLYSTLKRIMDICISFVLGICSLVLYPIVYLFIKLDDGGPLFISQERVGQHGRPVKIWKFRSMSKNIEDLSLGKNNRITKPGAFLRKTRIDELPQLWNVIKGDLSLIGPRPELPSGVRLYEKEISYYGIRHLIKPGLSGWAQLYHDNHPHHGLAVEETKEKLSYDLYYIKNRSLFLDVNIALKTIKKLLSREGI